LGSQPWTSYGSCSRPGEWSGSGRTCDRRAYQTITNMIWILHEHHVNELRTPNAHAYLQRALVSKIDSPISAFARVLSFTCLASWKCAALMRW
jgi:hypothetical protein